MLGRRAASQELVMLGERIRSQRIKLCLSQEALAACWGFCQGRKESGTRAYFTISAI